MSKHRLIQAVLIILILALIGISGYFAWQQFKTPAHQPASQNSGAVAKFSSAADFKAYLADAAFHTASPGRSADVFAPMTGGLENTTNKLGLGSTDSSTADRVSTTNVQVAGIDEPDIVTTDGRNIFVSSGTPYYYPADLLRSDAGRSYGSSESTIDPAGPITNGIAPDTKLIAPSPLPPADTTVVQAVPASTLAKIGSVPTNGTMLIDGQILVILGHTSITGYSLTDPAHPKQVWTNAYGDSSSLVTARLFNHTLYLVTLQYIQGNDPCPVKIMAVDSVGISVPCADIFHPLQSVNADTTFSALALDPQTGTVKKHVTFIGASSGTTVYMSEHSLYLAYTVYRDPAAYQYDFLRQSLSDLLPAALMTKAAQIAAYDISVQSKLYELQRLIDEDQRTRSRAEQGAFEKKVQARSTAYSAAHQREFTTTSLVSLPLDTLTVAHTASVPGAVLNQFALDEYQNHLRIATTSTGSYFGSNDQSANDVYVLDTALKQVGTILDLGKGERIYSARFIGDQGYLVTFKQTDPFYVLDMRDPANPKQVGELKLPGYSSYLHPLSDDRVLGIGQDGATSKATLFDVSNPAAPKELSTITLAEGWSEVQSNHHAFLQDPKHSIVFIPTSASGMIISYANSKLQPVKTLTVSQAQRAVYINDTLYIVSAHSVTALDESDWHQVQQITW